MKPCNAAERVNYDRLHQFIFFLSIALLLEDGKVQTKLKKKLAVLNEKGTSYSISMQMGYSVYKVDKLYRGINLLSKKLFLGDFSTEYWVLNLKAEQSSSLYSMAIFTELCREHASQQPNKQNGSFFTIVPLCSKLQRCQVYLTAILYNPRLDSTQIDGRNHFIQVSASGISLAPTQITSRLAPTNVDPRKLLFFNARALSQQHIQLLVQHYLQRNLMSFHKNLSQVSRNVVSLNRSLSHRG